MNMSEEGEIQRKIIYCILFFTSISIFIVFTTCLKLHMQTKHICMNFLCTISLAEGVTDFVYLAVQRNFVINIYSVDLQHPLHLPGAPVN